MGCFDESKKCYDGAISLRNENVYVENRARMMKDWCRELCGDAKKLEKARKLISQAIDDLSAIETDEDMREYVDMRNEINDRIDSERQLELLKAIGRENLFTITATSFYGYPHFDEGMILRLVKEPDNDYDSDAVAVYLDGKKVGYVANSPHTACYLTSTASSLDIPDSATGEYLMFYEFEYRIARIIRNRNTLYTK